MGSQSTHQLSHPTKHHNQINQLFSEQLKMKVSQVAAVLAVTASASAAPWRDGKKSLGGHWKGGWKNGHEEKCMDGPFEFTSTYSVVATPDQVVNSDNEFTGGLEGAKGFYEYGINSEEDYSAGTLSSRTSGVNTSLRLTLPPTFTRHPRARPARRVSLSPTRCRLEMARRGSALAA